MSRALACFHMHLASERASTSCNRNRATYVCTVACRYSDYPAIAMVTRAASNLHHASARAAMASDKRAVTSYIALASMHRYVAAIRHPSSCAQ